MSDVTHECRAMDLGINEGGRYRAFSEEQMLGALAWECWPHEARSGEAGWVHRARAALDRWLGQGLSCRVQAGQRLFDFAEVLNFLRWAGRVNRDAVFAENLVPAHRRRVRDLAPPGWERAAGVHAPRRFLLRLRREFNLAGRPAGAALRLRVPVPLEDPSISDIDVELVEPVGARIRADIPGRLEVHCARPADTALLAVEVRIVFTACCETVDADLTHIGEWDRGSPDYALYTRPVEGLIRVSDRIRELANSLALDAKNPGQTILAFWDFLLRHMHLGFIHHDELDVADPLGSLVERRWMDCYAGSALLAGLCRARGIPARLVNGFLLYPVAPSLHYWVEVLLPPHGWLPLDLYGLLLAGNDKDNCYWVRYFVGKLDYRLKFQRFPHAIIGNPGMPFPPHWHMLFSMTADGTDQSFFDVTTGQLLYRDLLHVDTVPAGSVSSSGGTLPTCPG